MKALSLWQPWATLMACGAKRIETRSWATSYRGPLVIHAAKRFVRVQRALCNYGSYHPALLEAGYSPPWDLPLGVAVAVVELVECRPSEELLAGLPDSEARFGDFSRGRFGWMTCSLQPLAEPVPMRGQRGLFDVDPDIAESIKEQL